MQPLLRPRFFPPFPDTRSCPMCEHAIRAAGRPRVGGAGHPGDIALLKARALAFRRMPGVAEKRPLVPVRLTVD